MLSSSVVNQAENVGRRKKGEGRGMRKMNESCFSSCRVYNSIGIFVHLLIAFLERERLAIIHSAASYPASPPNQAANIESPPLSAL